MKLRLFLRSFDSNQIKVASNKLQETLLKADCQMSGIVSLPLKIKRFCVLRSPHIDKDSREHFEIRISKRFFDISANSFSVLDLLLKTELPPGVSCSLKVLETD